MRTIRTAMLAAAVAAFGLGLAIGQLSPTPTVDGSSLTAAQTAIAYRLAVRAIAGDATDLAGTCEDDWDTAAECDTFLAMFDDLQTATLVPVYTSTFRGVRWRCGYGTCSAGWDRGRLRVNA